MSTDFINYTKEPVHTFTGVVDGELTQLLVHRCLRFGSHFLVKTEDGDTVAMVACRGIGSPVVISVDRDFDVPYKPVIYAMRQYWELSIHG